MTITTEEEYQAALLLAAPFFVSAPKPGTPEAARFVALLAEINTYDVSNSDSSGPAFEFQISGIKCDACAYRDDAVTVEQYPDYVNKACPECGANLLTEADYKTVQLILGMTEVFNAVEASDLLPSPPSMKYDISLSMNGSGEIKVQNRKDA